MKYLKNFHGDWDYREWQETKVKEKKSRKIKENRKRKAQLHRVIH